MKTMNKLLIKTVIVQPSYLICITTTGNAVTITEPREIDWILTKALPVFNDKTGSNAVLELNLTCLEDTVITCSDGSTITFNDKGISTEKEEYALDLRNLKEFTQYAKEHNYSIQPLIEKVTEALEFNNIESMRDLFTFLGKNNLPITKEGNILAYKILHVNDVSGEEFVDVFSQTVHQKVGDTVTMPKDFVTVDRNIHCASGLHACSIGYFKSFYIKNKHKISLVKIDPRDVCSVPKDTASKLRCCKYQILGLIEENELQAIYSNNLEEAPKYRELLNHAINEDFVGVNTTVELLNNSFQVAKEYKYTISNTFKLENTQQNSINTETLVDKATIEANDTFNTFYNSLQTVLKADNPELLNNTTLLRKIKKYHESFTWAELGINDIWRKRVLRRFKKYGI